MIKGPFYFDFGSEPTVPPTAKARFQERQSEEREQKLAEMLDSQMHPSAQGGRQVQSSAYRVSPAGSATSTNSIASSISEISSLEESLRVGGRVRQMFEERRKNGGGPLPVPVGWENQANPGRTQSSKSDPTSDGGGGRGRFTGNRPGRPRFNGPPPAPPRNPSKVKKGPAAGGGGGGGGGPKQTSSTMRRSRSIHQLENRQQEAEFGGGGDGVVGNGLDATVSSPPSLNPSHLSAPRSSYAGNHRMNPSTASVRSSSQPPRRSPASHDMNGNAEALAILDGADLPVHDKELLKQMFQEERRRLQDEMEKREESLMAKIRQQEEEIRRLANGAGPAPAAANGPKPRAGQAGTNKKPARNVTRVIKKPPPAEPVQSAPGKHSPVQDEPLTATEQKRANANARKAYKPPKPTKASQPSHPPAPAAPSSKPRPSPTGPTNIAEKKPAAPVQRAPPPEGMGQCPICGRNFNSDRLEKHQTICEKTTNKVRKKFDASKFRTTGLEGEGGLPPAKTNTKGRAKDKGRANAAHSQVASAEGGGESGKKRDWRAKRAEFLDAMREAKKVQKHLAAGGKLEDLPPPKPMDTSDYIQCPHCNRKFAESVAERHIPKCANIKSNKPR